MTAIEDARALVTELREIHARSRENAREQGWGVPPESDDHSPWSRAADMIERLTTPPTDDEREALADLIESVGVYIPGSHGHDYVNPGKAADAILAAGFRRQGTITDEVVEKAYRAYLDANRVPERFEHYLAKMRAALEAARAGGEGDET